MRFVLPGLLLALAAASPEAAELGQQAQSASPRPDCRCRANGERFELGARICLRTPEGYRLAECRMVQNVTSWSVSPEDCVVSRVEAAGPSRTGS